MNAAGTIRVTVPNRVDLAGGTLDIYPLYLLVPGAVTVNAAIDIRSIVEIRPTRGPARLVSENYRRRAEAPDTHGFPAAGPLGLVASALRFFPACRGVELRFRNEAPVGSGIGASSALLVAAMLAIGARLGRRAPWRETARAAMEIEAAHLRTLTGRQDHIAALRGGIQAIRFSPGRVEAARIAATDAVAKELSARAFLASTGKAHVSGSVNWRMVRGAIAGNREILGKFAGIAGAARDAWDALSSGDIPAAGRAVGREWRIRRTLAPGITLSRVEDAIASRAFRGCVAGAKLCGAGGGGMLFGILRDPSDRPRIESLLARLGFELYPFRPVGGPAVEKGA